MSKRIFERLVILGAAIVALAPGCNSSGPGTSGETHFLSCKENADCASLGPDYTCVDKVCRPRADASVGAGGGTSTGGTNSGGAGGASGAGGVSGGGGDGGIQSSSGGAALGGASGSDAGTDPTAVGTLGDNCSKNGAYTCAGHAQKGQLVCSGGGWASSGVCSGSNNCDTTPGANAGSCQPILAVCAGKQPGDFVCEGQNREQCGLDLVTVSIAETCTNQTCLSGACQGVCAPAQKQCSGNGVATCTASGQWGTSAPCTNQACVNGACTGVCTPTFAECSGNGVHTCDNTGHFGTVIPCASQACLDGACSGTCAPSTTQCSGNGVQTCDGTGHWGTVTACTNQTCVTGACTGVCAPGGTRCSGNGIQTCGAGGQWGTVAPCNAATPTCSNGTCTAQPSCGGLPATCGPGGNASCCSASVVTGGTFNRSNDSSYPATVSDFALDTYEVTVGRFRNFVAAYSQNMIATGAGKNPNNASDPGWNGAWNSSLPANGAALTTATKCGAPFQTWTDSPGANENRPMDCINWYMAHAFCIWDGGRLPTEAEWNYAAAGGSEQRQYPWGSAVPDCTYANFGGPNFPTTACVQPGSGGTNEVGSESPKGDGKWGQADMAGNVFEWTLDWVMRPYAQVSCVNCAAITGGTERVNRSSSFNNPAATLPSSFRNSSFPTDYMGLGVRCARNP